MKRKTVVYILIITLSFFMFGILGYKFFYLGYKFSDTLLQTKFLVDLNMSFTGFGDDILIQTFLPKKDKTQTIKDESIIAPGLDFKREYNHYNIRGQWMKKNANGPYTIQYSIEAQIQPVEYHIDSQLKIPNTYHNALKEFLKGTDKIQIHDPLIVTLSEKAKDKDNLIEKTLRNIFDYVSSLGSKSFKGETDALTAAKLGAASCNGKSRLFVAMARNAGIPTRLVGGLILQNGKKRTCHQWAEAYVSGHWVPFDALNSHFASLPGNYLTLYKGDEVLFKHSTNIGFDYNFKIKKHIIPNNRFSELPVFCSINLFNNNSQLPFNLFKIFFMIPLGVLIVVISKNIIGLHTFGTFMPALIAIAFRETGLIPGFIAFVLVFFVTILVRYPLEKLGILHTPKLAIMMLAVVFCIILLGAFSDTLQLGTFFSIGSVTLFPIVIITLTSERFAISLDEEGIYKTIMIFFQTIIVTSLCYMVINASGIQALMLVFPELLIGLIILNLYLGSWAGLRVTELFRFRSMLTNK